MNIGYSSRLKYDKCVYPDKIIESVGPGEYRLQEHQIDNCNKCLSTIGPRTSVSGYGGSIAIEQIPVASQYLVDVESILTNRNIKTSKCKNGKVNTIDVSKFKLYDAKICNNELNPEATHLTDPSYNYKELSIDRFYDLPKDPQENIFWNFARNSKLEATDNYKYKKRIQIDITKSLPIEKRGEVNTCNMTCSINKRC